MSRLIVKNLPYSITDSKLKTSFAKHGAVTDLQLKYNKEGKFRGFAFIGYSSKEEAQAAKQYLDGTFVGAAKIKVEFCNELGKSNKENSQKKTKVKEDKPKKVKDNSDIAKYENDPKFKEFMSAHGKKDLWSNNNENDKAKSTEVESKDEEDHDEEDDANEETEKVVSDLDYLKTKKKTTEKTFSFNLFPRIFL